MFHCHCSIDSHPALADMLSRVKRFAAPLILILPAPVWTLSASAVAAVSMNVEE